MAERKMLVRKRRFLNQQPVVRLKRATDDASLLNLKQHSHLFPINSSNDAVKCLKALISPVDGEPDLTLISLVLGALENALAEADSLGQESEDPKSSDERTFPTIRFEAMKSLYHKFHQNLKTQTPSNSSIQNEDTSESQCSSRRAEVRLVADKVWIQLARSYRKDKLRMQYLYSLLTEHKLDSFGVTSSVVAACQLLDVKDVRMVMSEDHSWIEFGDSDAAESMEVTWHGKCNEDRRGSPIPAEGNKWIYSSDSPVRCSATMTSALLASQLNPCIDGEVKSSRLLQIKRELMWFLHAEGLLKRLPMALIELAKLEAASSSIPYHPKTPHVVSLVEEEDKCLDLLRQAVRVAKELYKNRLVYPHLELGEYFLRKSRGSEAFRSWADAADIISLYNYGKEDEEVYKRFYEVANEAFINLLKKSIVEDATPCPDVEGKGVGRSDVETEVAEMPLCRSPRGFADFLRFYDGMCCWEEDSQTPVLHVKWAQSMCTALLKFNTQVRMEEVVIKCDGEEEDESEVGKPEGASDRPVSGPSADDDRGPDVKEEKDKEAELKSRNQHRKVECEKPPLEFVPEAICPKPLKVCNTHKPGNITKRKRGLIEVEEFGKEKHRNSVNNENCKYVPHADDRSLNTFEELSREISRQLGISRRQTTRESENPMLEVLSKNCSNSIFNPEFFQGHCGEPFLKSPFKAGANPLSSDSKSSSAQDQASHQRDPNKIDPAADGRDSKSASAVENGSAGLAVDDVGAPKSNPSVEVPSDRKGRKKVAILLKSSKMKSLRDLLALERMNAQAIKLQLTAQSNTFFNKHKASSRRQSGERAPEKEHLDRHAAFSPSAPCPPEGEVKVLRRVLRNRAAK